MKSSWDKNRIYNKRIRFLLIHPGSGKEGNALIPLGMAIIAAILENLNFFVRCKDYEVEEYNEKELIHFIEDKNINVIGFSSNTVDIKRAYKIAKIITLKFPNIKLIIGGHHPTIMPEEALENGLDIVYRGDSEESLMSSIPYLIEKQNNYKKLKDIRGISFRHQGKVINNGIAEPFTDLDSLPFPARHLFPFPQKYKKEIQLSRGSTGHIVTSRGCVGHCFFCSNIYRKVSVRSAKSIVDEMELLQKKYKVSQIYIADDFPTSNSNYILDICSEIKSRKLNITWGISNTRAEATSYSMFKQLRESGCYNISFGVESGSPKVRKKIGKLNSLQDVETAVRNAKKAGLMVGAFYIVGFPMETMDDIKLTMTYAKKLNTHLAQFHILMPFPGSPVFKYLTKNNRLKTMDWSKYTLGSRILFRPVNFTEKQLLDFLKQAKRSYYLRPLYFYSIVPVLAKNIKPYMWINAFKYMISNMFIRH